MLLSFSKLFKTSFIKNEYTEKILVNIDLNYSLVTRQNNKRFDENIISAPKMRKKYGADK